MMGIPTLVRQPPYIDTHTDLNLAEIASTDMAPGSKVHGVNMGPTWGRQDPRGPYVGPMNLAIWGIYVLRVSRMILFTTFHLISNK